MLACKTLVSSTTRPLDSAAQHLRLDRPGFLSVAYFAFQLMQLAISWRGDGFMRYHKSWPSIAFISNGLLGRRQRDQTDEEVVEARSRDGAVLLEKALGLE